MTPSPATLRPEEHAVSVKIHRSAAEVEELRTFWLKEQRHPNSDLDHFLLVCRLRTEVISPCVLSLWQDGSFRCVLAGRIEHSTVQPRVGYLKMPLLRRRALILIHGGAIGQLGPREADLIIARINQFLADGGVDVVVFSSLSEGSPLFASIRAMGRRVLGVAKPRWAKHWELTLPSQPGCLLQAMKSKHRSWIRRKARDLEAAFPARIDWRWHAQVDDLAPISRQIEEVAARTYQRGLDAGFKDNVFHRERLALFARQGRLRIMILEIDRRPAAFWFGIVYRGVFHSEATGFIPELSEYEIGTQVFISLVDELVRESVVRFDFGLGDAPYKQRFGDRSWRENTVWLFGSTWRGAALRTYLGTCEALDHALRAFVQRIGVADRLKHAWRRRLAHPENPVKMPPKPPTSGPAPLECRGTSRYDDGLVAARQIDQVKPRLPLFP
jgi:hypothetical protein